MLFVYFSRRFLYRLRVRIINTIKCIYYYFTQRVGIRVYNILNAYIDTHMVIITWHLQHCIVKRILFTVDLYGRIYFTINNYNRFNTNAFWKIFTIRRYLFSKSCATSKVHPRKTIENTNYTKHNNIFTLTYHRL